jgi:hypothetical protein
VARAVAHFKDGNSGLRGRNLDPSSNDDRCTGGVSMTVQASGRKVQGKSWKPCLLVDRKHSRY